MGSSASKASQAKSLMPRDLAALNIIRTETVLSKLPIHYLAKKGRVKIEIKRRNEHGAVNLQWKVSYSEEYGQARALAYKVDTLLINRRIDEAERPLPKLIKLGSLSQLCRDMDMPDSGQNTNNIKRAILQNASAFITAKLSYKGADGVERHLEAGFTRYNVIFTGERLPNGKKADAVYLILNDPYWEVLNNAPVRPLDYDYLRELPPAPQRCYEVISYRIFAALKYKHPHAKMSYSDYCTFSAQKRHLDHENFRVQMYKVHRPHVRSGYLEKVDFEETTDGEGKPDWMMYYTPGERAKAEYRAFTRKGQVIDIEPVPTKTNGAGESEPQGKRATPTKSVEPQPEERTDHELLTELTKRGIEEARARKLLASLAENQHVPDQLEWGQHLIAQAPKKYRNPPGFYIYLIEKNVIVPDDFETTRKKQLRLEAKEAQQSQHLNHYQLEVAYDEYVRGAVDRYIDEEMSKSERQRLVEASKQDLLKQHPYIAKWRQEQLDHVLGSVMQSAVKDRVQLLSFEEFCAKQRKK